MMGIGLGFRQRPLSELEVERGSAVPEAVEERHSPGLAAAISALPRDRPARVLDLGAVNGANVQFFAERGARLWIADLVRVVGAEEDQEDALRAALPPLAEDDPFDLILAWDVLNYLERDRVERLSSRLATLCRPGAALLAIMVNASEMSGSPLRYTIRSADSVRFGTTEASRRPAPQWPPAVVERCLQGFEVKHSFVLRSGVQEYLATRCAPEADCRVAACGRSSQ